MFDVGGAQTWGGAPKCQSSFARAFVAKSPISLLNIIYIGVSNPPWFLCIIGFSPPREPHSRSSLEPLRLEYRPVFPSSALEPDIPKIEHRPFSPQPPQPPYLSNNRKYAPLDSEYDVPPSPPPPLDSSSNGSERRHPRSRSVKQRPGFKQRKGPIPIYRN